MKNLDDVLKKSLTPAESEEGPDFWLNQNILKRADRQERGAKTMKKRTYRPTKAVAALVIALSISGSAVFAAEKQIYLEICLVKRIWDRWNLM